MKVFNRGVKLGGTVLNIGGTLVNVLEMDSDDNVTRATGTTVPFDGSAGYAKGCRFIDSDASAGSIEFINEGTSSSSSFRAAINGTAPSEVVTATNVILASESGKTFFLNSSTEFVSTLPAPALGLRYTFIVGAAPSGASYTVVTTSSANIIKGLQNSVAGDAGDNGTADDTITFVDGQAVAGDKVELFCDGTTWFAYAISKVAAGITFTQAS